MDYGGQAALPGLGPTPGDRWRNKGIDLICIIVAVEQRRRCWVIIRVRNGETEITLDDLYEFWRPM